MRIALYHPNLNLFGGGEAVALSIAEALSQENSVDIFTPYSINKKELETFFGLSLKNVNIVRFGALIAKIPFNTIAPKFLLKSAYSKLEGYDIVVDTCTNGWFDKQLKPKTICYVHFPFFFKKKKGLKSFLNRFLIFPERAFKYDKIFCNSGFTKKEMSKLTDKELEILYPPVAVEKIRPAKKKLNYIVTAGRFTKEKKHEIMIRAFKELCKTVKGYEFHLIGSFRENAALYDKPYFQALKEKAKGYPIEFHVNLPHEQVLRLLEKSKIYWHARGYGETDPAEYENFGITTVEAMAAGCIPFVINLGAQPEIVDDKKNGFVWDEPTDLIKLTLDLIKSKTIQHEIKNKTILKSKQFSSASFKKKVSDSIFSLMK